MIGHKKRDRDWWAVVAVFAVAQVLVPLARAQCPESGPSPTAQSLDSAGQYPGTLDRDHSQRGPAGIIYCRDYIYRVSPGSAPVSLDIGLSSPDVDSYLIVRWPHDALEARNDDDPSRLTLDSRLVVRLERPGDYRIIVTSLERTSTGPYTLSIRRAQGDATVETPVATRLIGSARDAALAAGEGPTFALQAAAGAPVEFEAEYPADARRATADDTLLIIAHGDDLSKLRITVGSRVFYDNPCAQTCPYRSHAGFRLAVEDVGAGHRETISITVTTEGGVNATAWLWYHKRLSFSGLGSPVLLRVSGTAAGFRLQNFAPSLSLGVQRNNNSHAFPYFAVNALLSVFSLPDSGAYALSLGAAVDFAGYLQVGGVYQTDVKKFFLVVGTRPEVLGRLALKSGNGK